MGVDQDWQKAVYWYQQSMQQDYAPAIFHFGGCAWEGVGMAKNVDLAIQCFQDAARLGLSEAQRVLAIVMPKTESFAGSLKS